MSKTLKVKLAGLGGVVIALVVTSGCMGGGGGKDRAQEYAQQACTQVARVCNDGSAAVRKDGETCIQTCPEDKEILDKVGDAVTGTGTSTATATGTGTGTGTSTATQTTCSSETYACGDGSVVGRDPGNGCQFRACPTR